MRVKKPDIFALLTVCVVTGVVVTTLAQATEGKAGSRSQGWPAMEITAFGECRFTPAPYTRCTGPGGFGLRVSRATVEQTHQHRGLELTFGVMLNRGKRFGMRFPDMWPSPGENDRPAAAATAGIPYFSVKRAYPGMGVHLGLVAQDQDSDAAGPLVFVSFDSHW